MLQHSDLSMIDTLDTQVRRVSLISIKKYLSSQVAEGQMSNVEPSAYWFPLSHQVTNVRRDLINKP